MAEKSRSPEPHSRITGSDSEQTSFFRGKLLGEARASGLGESLARAIIKAKVKRQKAKVR